ncbi:MAG: HEPN domain-containing protein [Oscillospiraceae bacterium]|jgi:hypothetical protein|nr:HEPN domain-containing protein [Oscillospiraceae bacterium]
MAPDFSILRDWLRIAEMDLAYAEHGWTMHPAPLELMCYHCQQAAEKLLKDNQFPLPRHSAGFCVAGREGGHGRDSLHVVTILST